MNKNGIEPTKPELETLVTLGDPKLNDRIVGVAFVEDGNPLYNDGQGGVIVVLEVEGNVSELDSETGMLELTPETVVRRIGMDMDTALSNLEIFEENGATDKAMFYRQIIEKIQEHSADPSGLQHISNVSDFQEEVEDVQQENEIDVKGPASAPAAIIDHKP